MKTLDRSAVTEIHKDVANALKAVADKHGLIYLDGTMRFNSSSTRMRVEFTTHEGTSLKAAPPAAFHRGSVCPFQIGDTVQVRSRQYKVTSVTSQGSILMDRLPDGKPFRLGKSHLDFATKVS